MKTEHEKKNKMLNGRSDEWIQENSKVLSMLEDLLDGIDCDKKIGQSCTELGRRYFEIQHDASTYDLSRLVSVLENDFNYEAILTLDKLVVSHQ